MIYTNSEVAGILQAENIKTNIVKAGDVLEFGEVKIEVVPAWHGYHCHYESPYHPQGTERFENIAKEKKVNYKVLENGESLTL